MGTEKEEEELEERSEEKDKELEKEEEKVEETPEKTQKVQKVKLTKFILKCSKSKCNYQRILMKRELSENDKTCPRCKSLMKIIQSS